MTDNTGNGNNISGGYTWSQTIASVAESASTSIVAVAETVKVTAQCASSAANCASQVACTSIAGVVHCVDLVAGNGGAMTYRVDGPMRVRGNGRPVQGQIQDSGVRVQEIEW